jgi:hypothetical protein
VPRARDAAEAAPALDCVSLNDLAFAVSGGEWMKARPMGKRSSLLVEDILNSERSLPLAAEVALLVLLPRATPARSVSADLRRRCLHLRYRHFVRDLAEPCP